MCMSIINSWVPILTILFHQITRCQSSVQIYLEFFIYKKAIPKHFFLSKIKTMICFLFIYILFLHASHFDWSMSRICQNHYYNDRDSYIFRKISAKICKTYIHKKPTSITTILGTLICAQSHIKIVLITQAYLCLLAIKFKKRTSRKCLINLYANLWAS